MIKRFIRIDLEYDADINSNTRMPSFAITDNIRRILAEDMPYVKILFTRDTANKDDLDIEKYRGPKND